VEIDHTGIVVRDINRAIASYTAAYGYTVECPVIYDPAQHVQLAMLSSTNGQRVELIQPVDETSPSHEFLNKGGGLQHICYRAENLEATIEQLSKQGHMLFKRPVPAPLLDGKRVAFLYVKQDRQFIELVETESR